MKYQSIHQKVRQMWGRASQCELCLGKKDSKRFEWSNKDHKYSLNKKDWWELCAKCHRQYDRKKFGWKHWRTGVKGMVEGQNISGLMGEPWNKGMRKHKNIKCPCGKEFYPPKKTSKFCTKTCAMKGNKRATNYLIAEGIVTVL